MCVWGGGGGWVCVGVYVCIQPSNSHRKTKLKQNTLAFCSLIVCCQLHPLQQMTGTLYSAIESSSNTLSPCSIKGAECGLVRRCDALSCIRRRIHFLLRIRIKKPGQGFDPWRDPSHRYNVSTSWRCNDVIGNLHVRIWYAASRVTQKIFAVLDV